MFYDKVICFDHFKKQIHLFQNIKLDDNLQENFQKGLDQLDQIEDLILNGPSASYELGELTSPVQAHFSKDEFTQMVDEAISQIKKDYIKQVVLSNYIKGDHQGDLLDTYRQLRTINQSPYMVYLNNKDVQISATSPETLVKVTGNQVYNYPLAGTRPRGKNQEEDLQLELDLVNDQKEISEHKMLVDLSISDIKKVCQTGSVEVSSYMEVLKYSHVMHLGSVVQGRLSQDKTPLDPLASLFPTGTLSGSPKVKTCQLIQKLEQDRRNIYGGALGYIDMSGNLDTCIAIGLAFKNKNTNQVIIRSGARIVEDSQPKTEYQECLNKAQALVEALVN